MIVPAMRLMVEVRELTGAGSRGLTRLPSGRRSSIGRKQPPLIGIDGSDIASTAKYAPAQAPEGTQLKGPRTRGARAREIDRHPVARDLDRDFDADQLVKIDPVVVEPVHVGIAPVRKALDGAPHELFGAGEELTGERGKTVRPVAIGELRHPARADRARRDLRVEVAHERLRHPHVEAEEIDEGAVDLAPVAELEGRDADPFLEDLGRVRGHGAGRHAPHVLVVGHRGAQGNRPSARKNRHDEGNVREVRPTEVRVVHDVDVALAHLRHRKLSEHRPHDRDEGREVDGDRGRLGERLALEGEEARRRVEPLLHDGRKRATDQGRLHLVRDAVELVAHHL